MPPVYLDCNATTPLDPKVRAVFLKFIDEEFGNAGSRTHEFGMRARSAVQRAREQIAQLVRCEVDEVIFTSGATESNNLALLGLADAGERTGRKHIVSTQIEHKAVLEPLAELEKRGFEITLLPSNERGGISVGDLEAALRPDTLLVSVMHVNNETGVILPLEAVSRSLANHPAYLHVDAAQGFGKLISDLQNPRIDLLSISGHKIYAPKGIGALIARRRGYDRLPIRPLLFGGGQERGLRPGTHPVALIAALGEASVQALQQNLKRNGICEKIKSLAVKALTDVGGVVTGGEASTISSTLNIAFPGLDSEALIVALKPHVAISNGSACTSHSYTASHVLRAMGLTAEHISSSLRFSWSHLTPAVNWGAVAETIAAMR